MARDNKAEAASKILTTFDDLSADAMLDGAQVAILARVAQSTFKRWCREDKAPRLTRINGRPRFRAADVRVWLSGSNPKK